jgi:type IV secretory pathway component VirB8
MLLNIKILIIQLLLIITTTEQYLVKIKNHKENMVITIIRTDSITYISLKFNII